MYVTIILILIVKKFKTENLSAESRDLNYINYLTIKCQSHQDTTVLPAW